MSCRGRGAVGEGVAATELSGVGTMGWAGAGGPRGRLGKRLPPQTRGARPSVATPVLGFRRLRGCPLQRVPHSVFTAPPHGASSGLRAGWAVGLPSPLPGCSPPRCAVVSPPLPAEPSGCGAALPRLHPRPCPACRPHCTQRSHFPATPRPAARAWTHGDKPDHTKVAESRLGTELEDSGSTALCAAPALLLRPRGGEGREGVSRLGMGGRGDVLGVPRTL